jgi:hypothetical protein
MASQGGRRKESEKKIEHHSKKKKTSNHKPLISRRSTKEAWLCLERQCGGRPMHVYLLSLP